jgi:hypothetical protein
MHVDDSGEVFAPDSTVWYQPAGSDLRHPAVVATPLDDLGFEYEIVYAGNRATTAHVTELSLR